MEKRIISLLLTVIMTMMLFSACSGSGSETAAKTDANTSTDSGGDVVTIRVLDTFGGIMEDMIALFEEQNPDIKIDYEFISADNYYAKFTAMNVSGEVPDVIWTNASFLLEQVKSDLLVELTDELATGMNYEGDEIWGETMLPSLLQNSRSLLRSLGGDYTDKNFTVPFTMTTVAVIYDKALFDSLGLNAPDDWEEFEQNNEILKEKGYVPISMQGQNLDWWPRFLWDQYCRDVLDAKPEAFETGEMTFQDEAIKQGLITFKEMWDKGWFPESGLTGNRDTMLQLFVQEEMPQLLIQSNYMQYLDENVPESVELASYPLPGVAGYPSRSMGGSSSNFAISKSSQHQEEALRFVKFITSKTAFSQDYARFVISGLTNVEMDEGDTLMKGYVDAANSGFTPDIYVPVNVTTEMSNTFRTDLLPNYLLEIYDLQYVIDTLDSMYQAALN